MEHHKLELTGLMIFLVAFANWYRGKEANSTIVLKSRATLRPIEG